MSQKCQNRNNCYGYRLFVRMFSRYWINLDPNIKWGLLEVFYNRPFLGIAAKVWEQYNGVEKQYWAQHEIRRMEDDQLIENINQHVIYVLSRLLRT